MRSPTLRRYQREPTETGVTVVWHGGVWRDVPRPDPTPSALPDYSSLMPAKTGRPSPSPDDVLAKLGTQRLRASQLAGQLKMDTKTVMGRLWTLQVRGAVVAETAPGGRRKVYRRAP